MESNEQHKNHLDQGRQYLTFVLAGEEYAIDILKVQEIRGFESTTQIPNTPEYLLGVINLRGSVVPIVDMRVRFSLSVEDSANPVIILVKHAASGSERIVGIVVDAVSDVYSISSEDVSKTPDLATNVVKQFVTGLATIEEKMIIMLDIDSLIGQGVLEDGQVMSEAEEA
ncbi:MAG: purine-binding chemotaxis protein CheW [Pseudomonadales bacterium]|nr:purine-binding chemotaxis protein CheW [Pseudomonadales bacterium]MBO6565762.1 purine-binding chemotaxis protein CheW [Pseudomonadales bacterium]MBO6597007.1 purine-binding chemotaxis protein CheW [Pseudomonadales bacterium]MBO6823807.1 purine-binding chemotaxis protein CheW [Pseudomonadales bacterium]